MDCEPQFDYGRHAGEWRYDGRRLPRGGRARAEGSDVELRLTTDLNMGIEGPRATARTMMKEGDTLFVALSWSDHPAPHHLRGRLRPPGLDRPPLAALARPRRVPRPPVAHLPPAQRADAQGPVLRAHRRAGGRGHHVAARDPRRRAQLGLPLHLDPRRHLHALGPLHARASTGRRTTSSTSSPTWPRARSPSSRSCTASAASTSCPRRARPPRPATRAPRRCGSATAPTTRTSTTCGARSSTRSTSTPSRATTCPSGSGRSSPSRSRPRSTTGATPTAASGRCAASPSTSPPPSSCAGWPPTAAPGWPRCEGSTSWPTAGRRPPTRSRTTSARTPSTTAACSASTTRPTRSTPRCCSCRWSASWTPRTSGSRRRCWRSPTS